MAQKITVTVSTKAKRNAVEKLSENQYKVLTTQAPEKGKANAKIIELLAKHLEIKKSQLTLLSGQTSKNKIFKID